MDFLFDLLYQTYQVFTGKEAVLALQFLFASSPVWLPVFLAIATWFVWIRYIRAKYIASLKYILLEIKLPPEVSKSPLAMELVLNGFFTTAGEAGWYKVYIKGQTRAYNAFEIVSLEGNVHFYIWTRATLRNTIEAQFYGQYPNIEIAEVPDYTDMIAHYDPKVYRLWGCHYKLALPDAYPIKTYIDYGLDKDPKEEFKIDPLTTVVEYLASLGKGEYAAIQIGFRAHKEKGAGNWFTKTTWQDETREIINKIYERMLPSTDEEEGTVTLRRAPTKAENMTIERLERIITKPAFDVGLRCLYFAKPEDFKGVNIPGLVIIFRSFGAMTPSKKEDRLAYAYNTISIEKATDYDYPWQDFRQMRELHNRHEIADAFRRRQFFHPPHDEHQMILSTEELATIFHPLGTSLLTPNVERVASRKAEPPQNLPR